MRPFTTRTLTRDREEGGRGRGGSRGSERGRGKEREHTRVFRKKICRFCTDKSLRIDYKELEVIMRFLTEKGKIIPRRITGNCSKHQRQIACSVKRCRHSALVAFQTE